MAVVSLVAQGCGHRQASIAPVIQEAPVYLIEVVGGEVEARRTDGMPWDQAETEVPGLGRLELRREPGRMTLVHVPRVITPGISDAPDVAVTLAWEGREVHAPASPDTFNPAWRYRFLLDPLLDESDTLTVTVEDDDEGSAQAMGIRSLPMSNLMTPGTYDFGPFGDVKHLQVVVTEASRARFPAFELSRLELQSTQLGWQDTGIEVLAGMYLAGTAEGKVRLSNLFSGMWGPEGVKDASLAARWQGYSVPGYEDLPHGAVIGAILDANTGRITQRLLIGDGVLTRLEGSGHLLIAINDVDVSNNFGFFSVHLGGGLRSPSPGSLVP